MISLEPQLIGGKRVYVIVFSSNAPDPANFDGVETAALTNDPNNGWNQEIWVYEIPAVADVDLTLGTEVQVDLVNSAGFSRVTNTPASRPPTPGATPFTLPFVADDSREPTISDDGTRLAFTSTRNLVPAVGNADGSPEIFVYNRGSGSFVQITKTQDVFDNTGRLVFSVFNANASMSTDGSVIAFVSNANLILTAGVAVEGAGQNGDDANNRGNNEIYRTTFSGSAITALKQVTRTKTDATQNTVNLFSPGRRLSRDGTMLLFDSLADDPKGNDAATNKTFYGIFLWTAASDTFNLVALRALPPSGDFGFVHFPSFTDYNASLAPATIVFASPLNYKADGTFPAANATDGLNNNNVTQIWATSIPVTSTNTLTRLTNNPVANSFALRALPSASRRRITFSLAGAELGGGNQDFSSEIFYFLSPANTAESAEPLSFFTGASAFPVPNASPTPTGSPTPTPSPSPSPSPSPTPSVSPTPATMGLGLAAGELTLVRAAAPLAPSNLASAGGVEGKRSPVLPVELNGVSVSVNGAASGLYFVGNSPSQINFVIPIGLGLGSFDVVVNNNGTVFRSRLSIIPAQPDIFTSTNGAGGRASICNITNGMAFPCLMEPFKVTSPDQTGTVVATRLLMNVTGIRGVTLASQLTVTIGTTDIVASAVRPNLEMPGWDIVEFVLPADLMPGDYPVILKYNPGGAIIPSRPADTAPHVTIIP
jgi:uncharacterized protein (TIGR03437 family)